MFSEARCLAGSFGLLTADVKVWERYFGAAQDHMLSIRFKAGIWALEGRWGHSSSKICCHGGLPVGRGMDQACGFS